MLAKMFLNGRHCYVAVTEMTEIENGHLTGGSKEFMVKLANGMQEKVIVRGDSLAGIDNGCIRLG